MDIKKYYISIEEIRKIKQQRTFYFDKKYTEEGKDILERLKKSKEEDNNQEYQLTTIYLESEGKNYYTYITTFDEKDKRIMGFNSSKEVMILDGKEIDVSKLKNSKFSVNKETRDLKKFNEKILDKRKEFYLFLLLRNVLKIKSPSVDNFLKDIYQVSGMPKPKVNRELWVNIRMLWCEEKNAYSMALNSFDIGIS